MSTTTMAATRSQPIAIRPNFGKMIRETVTERYEYHVINGVETLRDTSFRPRPANAVAIGEAIKRYGLEKRTIVVEIRTWEDDFLHTMRVMFPEAMMHIREVPNGNHELRLLYV